MLTKDNLPQILPPSSVLSSQPSFPPSSFRNPLPTVSPEVQVGLHLLHQNKAGEPAWANQCIMFPWPDHWRRQRHPTPVLLPGKSHGFRSLVGCSPWGCWESTKSLSDFTFTFHFYALEKEMATHSSVLALRIPGTGSLVGCRLWGHIGSDATGVT